MERQYSRQYIGARYVPIFLGDWSENANYEALSIVKYNNSSWISKKYVPAGIIPTESEFWSETGNYNGAINEIQKDIKELKDKTGYVTLTSLGVQYSSDMTSSVQSAIEYAENNNETLVFDIDVNVRNLTITKYVCIDFNGKKITAIPGGSGYFINININVSSISPSEGMKKCTFRDLWIDMKGNNDCSHALYVHGRNIYLDCVRIYDCGRHGVIIKKPDKFSTDGIYFGYLRIHGVSGSNTGLSCEVGDTYFDYVEISGFNLCVTIDSETTEPQYNLDNLFNCLHLWNNNGIGMAINAGDVSINNLILDSVGVGIILRAKTHLVINSIINTLVKSYIFKLEGSGSYENIVVGKINELTNNNLCDNFLNFNGCLLGNEITSEVTLSDSTKTYGTLRCIRKGNNVYLRYKGNANGKPESSLPALPIVYRNKYKTVMPLFPSSTNTTLANLGELILETNGIYVVQAQAYLTGSVFF